MVLRRSLLAGSLLLVAPACEQQTPATTAPAAQQAPAAEPAPDAPRPPRIGESCAPDGIRNQTATGRAIHCSKGVWEDADAGFVGVRRAGLPRTASRTLRA